MVNHKVMIDHALARMEGFTLERSSHSDNRSIFGLVKALVQSAHGDTLADCRKPLSVVLSIKIRSPKEKFKGCRLVLLKHTIEALFGGYGSLLSDKAFALPSDMEFASDKRKTQREYLLEYLEVCRRIFVSGYKPTKPIPSTGAEATEPKIEMET